MAASNKLKGAKIMKVKTNVKAGGIEWNHNETLICDAARAKTVRAKTQSKGLKVKSSVKAGVRVNDLANL